MATRCSQVPRVTVYSVHIIIVYCMYVRYRTVSELWCRCEIIFPNPKPLILDPYPGFHPRCFQESYSLTDFTFICLRRLSTLLEFLNNYRQNVPSNFSMRKNDRFRIRIQIRFQIQSLATDPYPDPQHWYHLSNSWQHSLHVYYEMERLMYCGKSSYIHYV